VFPNHMKSYEMLMLMSDKGGEHMYRCYMKARKRI
jgi:hypothetical protein